MIVEDLKKSILNHLLCGKSISKNLEHIKENANYVVENFPINWELVKIGNVIDIARGGSPRPIKSFLTNADDGINWIKIGDTVKGSKYINSCKEKIIKDGIKKSRQVHKGDFLLSNSMSFGRPYILNIDGCIHDGWLVLTDKNNIFLKDYLFYVLSSDLVYKQFCDKASGAVVNNLNIDKVKETVIPLPPIEEQQRIVDKIEELFAKLDEIKPIEEELSKLKSDFPNDMKKSILFGAISGKLTTQNENENVDKIVNEIKKETSISNSNNIPFEIPQNWIWIKFGELVKFNIGKTPPRSDMLFWGNDYNWVSISDMVENGYINETKEKISTKANNEIFKGNISKKGTLLMSFKLTVGRCSILNIDSYHNEGIISVYPNYDSKILKQYLFRILPFISNFGEKKNAIKGSTLNSKSLNNLMIPLPPIEEQQRIVDKIEELLPLCEDIEKLVSK